MRKNILIVGALICILPSCTSNLENEQLDNEGIEPPKVMYSNEYLGIDTKHIIDLSATRAISLYAQPGDIYTGIKNGFTEVDGFDTKIYHGVSFPSEILQSTGLKNTPYDVRIRTVRHIVEYDPTLWDFTPLDSPGCGFLPGASITSPQRGYKAIKLAEGKYALETYQYQIENMEAYDIHTPWDIWVPCRKHELIFTWQHKRLR